ncbi:MAG: hypothetical protein WD967_00970 [Candidatus Levyibacteriota bacterium]
MEEKNWREIENIGLRINAAKQNPVPESVFSSAAIQTDALLRSFISGERTRAQLEADFSNLPEYGVILANLNDFALGLEIAGFSNEDRQEMIEHESEHTEGAERLGFKSDFTIVFVRTEDGRLKLNPGTTIRELPEKLSDEELRAALREVIGAPHDLSDRDRNQLGSI